MTLSLPGLRYSAVYPKDLCWVQSYFLYILTAEMQNPVLLFADDTKIFCKISKNDGLEDIARI